MYRVIRPKYVKTGEVVESHGEEIPVMKVAGWIELGVAASMEEANERFPRGRKNGYSHILEEIRIH